MEALQGGSYIALICTAGGGVLVKVIDKIIEWMRSRHKERLGIEKTQIDAAASLRDELYKENIELRAEVMKAYAECQRFRDLYNAEREGYVTYRAKMRNDLEDCERKIRRMDESERRRVAKAQTDAKP